MKVEGCSVIFSPFGPAKLTETFRSGLPTGFVPVESRRDTRMRSSPTPRRLVTRFQKLAAATVVTSILLVTVGVIVRATGSGLGCPDWPLCNGQLIPAFDDPKAWIEWVHRTVAVIIGFEVIGLAALALIDHRDRRLLVVASVVAVALVVFQAWLGKETVRLGNSGESVTAHLASAMTLAGLLVWIFVRSLSPARLAPGGTSERLTLIAPFGAGCVLALLLCGS